MHLRLDANHLEQHLCQLPRESGYGAFSLNLLFGMNIIYKFSLVSQRWEEVLLNRVLADFRPILQFAQQG